MKVISLHQPHALLAAHGYKTIETRDYAAKHRGWVAIHATKEWPDEYRGMMDVWPTNDCLIKINNERADRGWDPFFRTDAGWPSTRQVDAQYGQEIADGLPRGAIVGIAWLAKVERTDGITERWNRNEDAWKLPEPDYNDVPRWEPSFGDYRKGRQAWWLCHPVPLRTPIAVAGWPGMWDTEAAARRDRGDGLAKTPGARFDYIEAQVQMDIAEQGLPLPDQFDPAFFRLISRRGETDATRPRNM